MKNRGIKSFLMMIIVILIMPVLVWAKEDIILVTDKTDLKVGDEVNVTAFLPNEEKFYALMATLNYDKDVFEALDTSDFVMANDNLDISYSYNTNKFGIINKSGEIANELFKIKLKVKDDAKVGDTNIALTNISASNGHEKIEFNKNITKVLVTRDAKDGELIPQNKPNEIFEIKDNIIKTNSTMPYVIGLGIVIVILLGIFIYTYIFYVNRKKTLISVFILLVIGVITFSSLLGNNLNKKDVNNDGYKTYDDAKEIMEYLINVVGTEPEVEELPDNNSNITPSKPSKKPTTVARPNKNENTNNESSNNNQNNNHKNPNDFDVNNDGKVDIEDVGDNTEHVTEEVRYKVNLREMNNEDYYLPKGQITLNFTAEVSPNEKIKQVKINNQDYLVGFNGNYYTVILDNIKTSGLKEFKFTEVVLNNGRTVKVKLTIKKEILKNVPYVDLFNIDDENNTFNFKLEDSDNALIKGNVVIIDNEGNEVLNETISKENHFTHEFAKEKTYTIYVYATYDLDSNTDDNKNLYKNVELYKHNFAIASNYHFKVNNVTITDAISKDDKVKITFDSTNNYNYKIEYIVINGQEYHPTLNKNNHYEFVLDNIDTSICGKNYLNIEKIVLSNLKPFENKKDYEINPLIYNVLKKEPTIDGIELKEDKNTQSIKATYKLNDTDNTLEKLTAVLVDSTNKTLDTKEDVKNGDVINLNYGNNSDGRYKVKFLATYNLGTERHQFTNKNIGEKEILTQVDVYIKNISEYKVYPTKNENKYTIKYELYVSDNFKSKYPNYNEVAGITINGLNYDGNKTKDYGVVIGFTVPSESGVVDLTATRVKLQNESYQGVEHMFLSVAPKTIQIDVLKDKPQITDFQVVKEDYDQGEVTFKFNVVDDKGGFEKGTLNLYGYFEEIHLGMNEITFSNLPKDTLFDLNFYGNYDLDTNTLPEEENKNKYNNELIETIKYGLYNKDNYENIKLVNVKGLSKNNDTYFEKNKNIKISFDVLGLDFDDTLKITKVNLKGKEYNVMKEDNGYSFVIEGYSDSGVKEITISDILLNNGKKITLTNPTKTQVEVLKDPVEITDFKYQINDKNILVSLTLNDKDKAINGSLNQETLVQVYDENNKLLEIIPYNKEMTITRKDNIERYNIRLYVNYDRDIEKGNANYFGQSKILDEVISVAKNTIELKDIVDVNLYTEEDGKTILKDEINVNVLQSNQDSYFVEIKMREMATVYAKIKNVVIEDNKLVLVLDYQYASKNGNQTEDLRIELGNIIDGKVINTNHPDTLEDLIKRIQNNPSGEFSLTNDYDADGINNEGKALIDIEFKGILKGNGYKIKNLNKPLFNTINGGEVSELELENVKFGTNTYQGSLANTASNATIKNVWINGFSKSNSNSSSGSLLGEANNSLIENCRVINLNFDGNYLSQGLGGLIGVTNKTDIKNCYAIGKMSGGWNYHAGLVGNANNGEISNSYTKITFTGGSGTSCGMACSYRGGLKITDSISLSTGVLYNFTHINSNLNNYALTNEASTNQTGITNIESSEVNKDLFTKAYFKEEIWNLKNISYDNTPRFNKEKVYVLNIDEVSDLYDEDKEILYTNLRLLMPFYDSKKIAETALNIPTDSLLYQEEIKHLVPVDVNGNVVTYLTSDNVNKIQKIKVVYKSNKKEEYLVRYDKTFDMVASYRIKDLQIDYTFNHYVINNNSQLVNNLTNYLLSLTYEDNLDPLTSVSDSRLYKEFYYDETQKELKEFVLKYLSNSNYTNTTNSEVIDDYLEKEIKKDQKLEKILYVYNYYKRFYDISIDGIKLYDLILFNFTGFSSDLNAYNIATNFLSNNTNIETNRTNDAYRNVLSSYTNLNNLPDFLTYLVNVFGSGNVDSWYADTFKGYLVEIPVAGKPEIMYTLWSHLSHIDKNTNVNWYNYILPIATLPKDAAYIISTPVQFIIGAQRTYITDPSDATMQAQLQHRIATYTERMRDYFKTSSELIDTKYFNNIHTIQIDKRYTYDINGNQIFQGKYTTEEPFHKNFNEVLNQWAYNDYNAATANGAQIIWRVEGLMDGDLDKGSEYTFHTWSHETAHNIDARLFLEDNGRRFDAGGEDYADSNLMQAFGDGDIVMNLSRHFTSGDKISSNLDPSRIDSYEEIEDFYKKLFQTIYIMDYLEGRAILNLSSDDISKLVVEANYPNQNQYAYEGEGDLPPKPYYRNYLTTVYQTIDASKVASMKLEKVADLYKNRLVMFPGVIYSTYTDNRYGGENIYKVHWYQPHNDYGRPDSYSIKWFAYEMLGYKGYKDGYIEYFSNINSTPKTFAQIDKNGDYTYDKNGNLLTSNVNYKTDLMAIRKITNDPTMDFEKYKLGRFKEVEDNLANIQYIDVYEYYNKFYEALKLDAEVVREAEKNALIQYPNDTSKQNSLISEARKYKNSTEVRRQLFYTIKNNSDDFVKLVYDPSNPQDIQNFLNNVK